MLNLIVTRATAAGITWHVEADENGAMGEIVAMESGTPHLVGENPFTGLVNGWIKSAVSIDWSADAPAGVTPDGYRYVVRLAEPPDALGYCGDPVYSTLDIPLSDDPQTFDLTTI